MAGIDFATPAPLTITPPRIWKPIEFDYAYNQFLAVDELQFGGDLGSRTYQLRYRSRYELCIRRFAQLAPRHPLDVLDVGGGQLALLCSKLWHDHATVVDLPGPHMHYMAKHGIDTKYWNLCQGDAPFNARFDFIFFSEVIEHLPIPAHIVLERLRKLLRPGGILLCTTPNFFRLRNLALMLLGRDFLENWHYPDPNTSLSHVTEFSERRLAWQFERAGFPNRTVELVHMAHAPSNALLRPFAWLGYPLHLIPHFRDNLVVTAYAPE